MKKTLITLAALLMASAANANTIDLSDRNSGLTKDVMCSNVPANNGSAPGFFIPTIGYFIAEASAERNPNAFVVPAAVDVKRADEVGPWLMSVGLTNFDFVVKRESREVEEEVPVARETFDGTPQDWRVTSMDGTNTVRVRTLDDRPVQLRIGGNVILETSGVGQAYFDLPAGQSFGGIKIHDATTGEALRNGTASTNGSIWDGTETVTRLFSSAGRWCR